jgi:hypothetical protein
VELLRDPDLAVLQADPLLVTDLVRGQDLLEGQIAGLLDNHFDGFLVEFGELLVLAELIHRELLEHDKVDVPAVGDLLCHCAALLARVWG